MPKEVSSSAQQKVIVFDFDGTLADSLQMVIDIFRSLVPGHDDASDEQIEALRSLSVKHIAKALGVPMWKVPLLVRKGRKVMHTRVDDLPIIDGVPSALAELHDRGFRMFVASSNSEENIQKFLERYELDQFFDGILGGIGLFGKARAVKKLCRTKKLDRTQVWYVGDEVRDIIAAKKAGVKAVAVGWGFNHPASLIEMEPDLFVVTPRELVDKLEG